MVAAIKLLHLLEAFSTPWFLFSAPSNHHLVFFLLEIFNNIIQYQFDGNANLVYTIIRKRHVFHSLANLPSDVHGISKCLNSRKIAAVGNQSLDRVNKSNHHHQHHHQSTSPTIERKSFNNDDSVAAVVAVATPTPTPPPLKTFHEDEDTSSIENKSDIEESMEGSHPAQPAEPGTLKATLLETPAISTMTEPESAHPLEAPLCDFSPLTEHCDTQNVQDEADLSKLTINENEPDEAPIKRTVNQVRKLNLLAKNEFDFQKLFVFSAWQHPRIIESSEFSVSLDTNT